MLRILKILDEAERDSQIIGREKIQQMLEVSGYKLSIQQVKTRIENLRKHGLVETRNGKGTNITQSGVMYLQSETPVHQNVRFGKAETQQKRQSLSF
jgi:repressor of nif and glnA expression